MGIFLVICFFFANGLSAANEDVIGLIFLGELAVSAWIGASGNEMLVNNLIKKGYKLVGTVNASSAYQALEKFEQNDTLLSPENVEIEEEKEVVSGPNSWQCNNCGEVLEYQFDTCWKCGADRHL